MGNPKITGKVINESALMAQMCLVNMAIAIIEKKKNGDDCCCCDAQLIVLHNQVDQLNSYYAADEVIDASTVGTLTRAKTVITINGITEASNTVSLSIDSVEFGIDYSHVTAAFQTGANLVNDLTTDLQSEFTTPTEAIFSIAGVSDGNNGILTITWNSCLLPTDLEIVLISIREPAPTSVNTEGICVTNIVAVDYSEGNCLDEVQIQKILSSVRTVCGCEQFTTLTHYTNNVETEY